MSSTKSRPKRTTKPKKAPTKRSMARKMPAEKPQKKAQEQWGNGEMEHEKMEHPWPETEKEPMGDGANDQQKVW